VDSGCTDHMFNQSDFFTVIEPHVGSVHIGEKGRSIEIQGKGVVRLKAINHGLVELKNCYFVPDLPHNLLSLSSMWRNGLQIEHQDGDVFQIKKNKKVIFDGKVKSRLLHANLESNKKEVNSCITHARVGHKGSDENCESCKLGKMTRNKFSKSRIRTNIVGEEFSIDLAGQFSPMSLGGGKILYQFS